MKKDKLILLLYSIFLLLSLILTTIYAVGINELNLIDCDKEYYNENDLRLCESWNADIIEENSTYATVMIWIYIFGVVSTFLFIFLWFIYTICF